MVDGSRISRLMPVRHCNSRPPMLSVSFQHHRHTFEGVKQNGVFSVNIRPVDLVEETDYCGIVSGTEADKAADCKFKVYSGKLTGAPLTPNAGQPECRVMHILNLGTHEMVVWGRSKKCMSLTPA
jgi:flavin reductase (DIM6/NTAB) family NADH-FMN oxidoreductase RutF